MQSFKHITPQSRIFYGPDSLNHLRSELKHAHSRRALIFCDPFLVEEGVLLKKVQEEIGDLCVGIFSGIQPNSPLPMVEQGAEEIRRLNADALVVIGGGSSTVTARAAAILAAENKDAHVLCTSRDAEGKLVSPKLLEPKIPLLIIPTTPITAMVKAGASILDAESNRQLALFDPKTRGCAIFIHPDFVRSMPDRLLLSACMSTLAATVDGLLSTSGDQMSDALLIHAMRLLTRNLADPAHLDDVDTRCELMLATVLCGMGSDYTGFGISVVLGHAMCAHFPLNAGFLNGVTIPYTLRFNRSAVTGMEKLAVAMNIDSNCEGFADTVIDRIETILKRLDIPHKLREVGMPHEKFSEVAASAMDDWYLHFNPVPVRAADLEEILEQAW